MDKAKKSNKKDRSSFEKLCLFILNEHSWCLIFILVPISLGYDLFFKFLKLINSIIGYSNASHEEKLKDVQRQVRHRLDTGDKRPMCTARPGYKSITLQQITYKETCYKININMSNVIDLDTKNQRVLVEPMIDIGTLNDYLISQGWTLPVVPELDELTIGGLVMGGGIETTSNKYGLFQYICTMYELVLPDGSVLKCTENQNEELFCATPFCYGTLGLLTAVELKIIPYKPYLKLTYIPTGSIKEFIHEFEKIVNDETIDSIEGIVYSFDKAILMKGEFVDESVRSSYPVNSIGRWYKEWFYTHVEKFLKKDKEYTELIPTRHFFHRHNKSWFWLLKDIFTNFCNHPIFRYTLGWTLPPKFSFLKFLRHRFVPPGEIDNFICQDFGFELDNLEDALRFVDEQCKVYPLWICPTRHLIPKHLEDYSQFHKDTIHIDVGIYG
uniref:Delta(24)-sterol reductase n=1 Tax=Lepeophtheirus salmonis TaxID=72036 RepID=A0A0K2UHG8_LEPSM